MAMDSLCCCFRNYWRSAGAFYQGLARVLGARKISSFGSELIPAIAVGYALYALGIALTQPVKSVIERLNSLLVNAL
jgi:hypothetical protein